VAVTNPDDDCSAEAFHAFLDDLLAGPDPELESLGAPEALRKLRVDAEDLTAVVIDASAGVEVVADTRWGRALGRLPSAGS
jgi:hypothetical protein